MGVVSLEKMNVEHRTSNIEFLKTNEIKLRSGATSLFDVQRSMFDVHLFSPLSYKNWDSRKY